MRVVGHLQLQLGAYCAVVHFLSVAVPRQSLTADAGNKGPASSVCPLRVRLRLQSDCDQQAGVGQKVLTYHNGRGAQEGLFAELKSQTQVDYVPTQKLVGNQVYALAAMLAHNLNREMQMQSLPKARPNAGRHCGSLSNSAPCDAS